MYNLLVYSKRLSYSHGKKILAIKNDFYNVFVKKVDFNNAETILIVAPHPKKTTTQEYSDVVPVLTNLVLQRAKSCLSRNAAPADLLGRCNTDNKTRPAVHAIL